MNVKPIQSQKKPLFKGIQKTTLLDYPGEIACTFFTMGCNFRCGYCYNTALVEGLETGVFISFEEALCFLDERKSFLSGVCITGGEPLLHYEQLQPFLKETKALGYKIKIDTNGTYMEPLKKLISNGLADYIAMDIKAPLSKYAAVTNTEVDIDAIKGSILLLRSSEVEYEFRTTVYNGLDISDFEEMSELLAGSRRYYLQKLNTSLPVLDAEFFKKYQPVPIEGIRQIINKIGPKFGRIRVRGYF